MSLMPSTVPGLGGFEPIAEGDPLPPEDRRPSAPPRLEALYRAHGHRLKRFFSRRAERQDTADLVQDCFVRLAGADAVKTDTVDEPAAYLSQVATNLLRDRARAAYHRSVALGDPACRIEPAGPDPVAQLEARDRLQRVDRALAKLNPRTRQIFLAHRLEGASYAEIAARTGLSVKGVEWHMSKAIGLVHRLLDRP